MVPKKVIELFPKDPDLSPLNAVSYMGYPLFGEAEEVIGHLAIISDAPLHPNKEQEAVFRLFVQRANAEFLRMKAYEELEEKKFRLSSLIDSMHEAVVEVDDFGFITLANPASEFLFGNIRELQHVMERAVILAKDQRLHLKRFTPYGFLPDGNNELQTDHPSLKKIMTTEELAQLEKQNLCLVLERAHWKISGSSGAGALLGIPSTTLNSKIKALGILKPS